MRRFLPGVLLVAALWGTSPAEIEIGELERQLESARGSERVSVLNQLARKTSALRLGGPQYARRHSRFQTVRRSPCGGRKSIHLYMDSPNPHLSPHGRRPLLRRRSRWLVRNAG